MVAAFAGRIDYALTSFVDHKTELQEALAREGRSVNGAPAGARSRLLHGHSLCRLAPLRSEGAVEGHCTLWQRAGNPVVFRLALEFPGRRWRENLFPAQTPRDHRL